MIIAPYFIAVDLYVSGGGGVLELFFDGVSGPRSGTPTHI